MIGARSKGVVEDFALTCRQGQADLQHRLRRYEARCRDFATTQLTSILDENTKLTDCYYEKKDWRACKQEVSRRRPSGGVAFRALLSRVVAEPSRPASDEMA